jgi:hypothetical protein
MAKKGSKKKKTKNPKSNVLQFPLSKLPTPKFKSATALFQFGLRGGRTVSVMLTAAELDRIWAKIQEPDSFHRFIVFDSMQRRSALNVRHVQWSMFDGAPIKPALYLDGAGPTVDVLFEGESKVWQFGVDPDKCALERIGEGDEDGEESAQMANLFLNLDGAHRGADYAQPLINSAGATIWLRLNEISLVTAPLSLFASTGD